MGERAPRHLIRVEVRPPYPVTVGEGLLAEVAGSVDEPRVAIVSDAVVAGHYLADLEATLSGAGKVVSAHVVPAGEASKSASHWLELQRAFARAGLDRASAVVALGGGVVGDLAGFAAATYLRGVAWYQLPTSLLAMVDASVGGKTAIDLPEGKNLTGAFWQPRAVIADVATLATLPETELRQGAVELFKHGLLADRSLLDDFDATFGSSPRSPGALADAIARSVAVKAAIVAADEREGGVRAHLNLGHTLAHALEAVSGHRLTHGDAVAYGLHFAALLGRQRGHEDVTGATSRLLAWVRPAPLGVTELAALLPTMARDKKNLRGRRRFVLLRAVGEPCIVDDVSEPELERAWGALLEEVGA